ncbi:phospholipid scramblase 2-like [Anneissia japonica]|uniref:phospholipid scramblase 2-like n=1 Tax=Anneissia japonica TaxID=1529436 RepID=UPI0014259359|nr:phospholipid scramblase 2-like [Anneissia japonica]
MTARPVTKQPRSKTASSFELTWVRSPVERTEEGIPAELMVLKDIQKLIIRQTADTIGVGCNQDNEYRILNKTKQQVFFATEETTCCCRCLCGPARSFNIYLQNKHGQEIVRFVRPVRCDGCCCMCCMMRLMIQTPDGEVLGYVKQKWKLFGAKVVVETFDGKPILEIVTSCCPCRCFRDMEFKVFALETEEEGAIKKQWRGKKDTLNVDHEQFIINFPSNLDVIGKTLLIGASFLMDFMFFEMT